MSTADPTIQAQEQTANLYSRVAPRYAELGPPYFAHAGKRLVELAGLQPGDVVLDLGTGRGAVLLPAATRVAPGGSALGIDIAPGMVEHTTRTIQASNLRKASVQLLDISQSSVLESNYFTHVLSSFSVFFFPDLPRVLSELLRVLRPGGVVGFAFSRGTDPRWTWYEQLLRDLGALDGSPAPTGYPRVRDPGVLTGLLDQAGFVDAHEREETTDLWYASADAWWASLWVHGSRRPLERLAPDVLAELQRDALARVSAMTLPEGVPERMQLVYVLARRPE